MEGGSDFHPALKLLQDANQARGQLECELVQETQELAQRYDHKQIKQARRHERQQAWIIKQTNATFQEVLSKFGRFHQVTALINFYGSAPLLYEWNNSPCHATG